MLLSAAFNILPEFRPLPGLASVLSWFGAFDLRHKGFYFHWSRLSLPFWEWSVGSTLGKRPQCWLMLHLAVLRVEGCHCLSYLAVGSCPAGLLEEKGVKFHA